MGGDVPAGLEEYTDGYMQMVTMTLNDAGVFYEELQGACWAATADPVGKFCYGIQAGDDDKLMLGHGAAYFANEQVAEEEVAEDEYDAEVETEAEAL
jgi:hypothetical protein